MEVTTDTLVLA